MITIIGAFRKLANALQPVYDKREAENIADIVIEKLTGLKRIDRILNQESSLSPEQEKKLEHYIAELLLHKPLQYIIQESWFYELPFFVNEHVLIPRPETEELVEWIVTDAKERLSPPAILDIGTGSGCIPVALKKNILNAWLTAVDISEQALLVAKKNADNNNVTIDFLLVDILSQKKISSLPSFDIIVSNPPYIPVSDMVEMRENVVNYEPHLALFVENNDPLLFYRAISDFAVSHLATSGCIYVEIHEAMGEAVKKQFEVNGFSNTIIKKDMQGKYRMIRACR